MKNQQKHLPAIFLVCKFEHTITDKIPLLVGTT